MVCVVLLFASKDAALVIQSSGSRCREFHNALALLQQRGDGGVLGVCPLTSTTMLRSGEGVPDTATNCDNVAHKSTSVTGDAVVAACSTMECSPLCAEVRVHVTALHAWPVPSSVWQKEQDALRHSVLACASEANTEGFDQHHIAQQVRKVHARLRARCCNVPFRLCCIAQGQEGHPCRRAFGRAQHLGGVP